MGFLNIQLDTILKKEATYRANFILGNSTKTIRIYYDNTSITKEFLKPISQHVKDDFFEIGLNLVPNALTSIASQYESRGDVFTEVYLTNIIVKHNYLSSQLVIKKSTIRTIDKVVIKGDTDFPKTFVKHYFNINNRTIFNRKKLLSIANQIKALPFIDQAKPSEVLFTNDSTFLYIYVKKKKSNKFDGLIGFSSTESNNNISFNGYLDLALNNIFKGGENITLNWKNNGSNRQFFNFKVETPYIFNSSITPVIGLNIYKQDSTFVNTKMTIDLNYALNYENKIGVAYISESSTDLLDNPISNLDNYTSILYGITYNHTVLSNKVLYPIKFNFNLNAYTGIRKTTTLKNKQTQLNLDAQYILTLNAKNSFFIRSSNGMLFSDNFLTNELYRLGGVNSIRGFNEESIFASLYSIANIEFRYNTNISSYLFTITDAGFIQNELENINQRIYSLGLGYTFNTNFGILSLSYALGKLDNLPFGFNDSQFHLKIESFF